MIRYNPPLWYEYIMRVYTFKKAEFLKRIEKYPLRVATLSGFSGLVYHLQENCAF